jgi:fatty acid desaturase
MSSLRASDADRERTAERLRAASAEGRIPTDELEQRLEATFAARTEAELERVVADLPAPPPPARRSRRRAELRVFAAVSVLLVAIWALTGADYFWPVWPILGWGVFLLPWAPVGFQPRCHRNASSRL